MAVVMANRVLDQNFTIASYLLAKWSVFICNHLENGECCFIARIACIKPVSVDRQFDTFFTVCFVLLITKPSSLCKYFRKQSSLSLGIKVLCCAALVTNWKESSNCGTHTEASAFVFRSTGCNILVICTADLDKNQSINRK